MFRRKFLESFVRHRVLILSPSGNKIGFETKCRVDFPPERLLPENSYLTLSNEKNVYTLKKKKIITFQIFFKLLKSGNIC